MQPRTKKEIEIAKLSEALPPLTAEQELFIKEKCFDKSAYRTVHTLTCMECGEKIEYTDKKHCVCEKCGAKVKITDTRARVNQYVKYHCVVTASGNYQVLRFFIIKKYEKKGQPAYYCWFEAVRHFIDENGKDTIFALASCLGGYYNDLWNVTSDITLKRPCGDNYYIKSKYYINPLTYDKKWRVLPKLRRNGLKKNFHLINPIDVCCSLLSNNKMETLWKAGQYSFFSFFKNKNDELAELYGLWQVVRICLRNNYIVKDAQLWYDYISTLHFFNKDCRNAFYACPTDLKAEHDKWLEKKKTYQKNQAEEEKKRKSAKFEAQFRELKGKFIGISIKQDDIEISALKSVKQYVEEADAMHHCVYENEYFLKPNSLVLSARVDGERAETVEVSLRTGKVLQSRAKFNGKSEYHNRIVNLVNKQFINKLKTIKK